MEKQSNVVIFVIKNPNFKKGRNEEPHCSENVSIIDFSLVEDEHLGGFSAIFKGRDPLQKRLGKTKANCELRFSGVRALDLYSKLKL